MSEQKPATIITEAANKALYDDPNLDWKDTLAAESAQRGFIARLENPVIQTADGGPVWNL